MGNARQLVPAARRDDLVIQEVDSETLLYDLKSHKAHCLNRTAALVWKHCDGKQSAAQVAHKLEAEIGEPVSTEVVWLAVAQLEKSGLLEEPVKRAPGMESMERMSRRELARRLGITAAVVALPLITTIKAPAAIQALSCGGPGAACGAGLPLCCPPMGCNPFTNQCANL